MFDFFCSFDGCSMSMSYRFWPSTMATRSSSACVALISIRFIVSVLTRSTARNAGVRAHLTRLEAQAHSSRGRNFQRYKNRRRTHGSALSFVSLGVPDDAERLPDLPEPQVRGDIRPPSRPANMVTPGGCGSGLSGFTYQRLSAHSPVKSGRYLA